eukprot:gene21901-28943_t
MSSYGDAWKATKTCKHYLAGRCFQGNKCPFLHGQEVAQRPAQPPPGPPKGPPLRPPSAKQQPQGSTSRKYSPFPTAPEPQGPPPGPPPTMYPLPQVPFPTHQGPPPPKFSPSSTVQQPKGPPRSQFSPFPTAPEPQRPPQVPFPSPQGPPPPKFSPGSTVQQPKGPPRSQFSPGSTAQQPNSQRAQIFPIPPTPQPGSREAEDQYRRIMMQYEEHHRSQQQLKFQEQSLAMSDVEWLERTGAVDRPPQAYSSNISKKSLLEQMVQDRYNRQNADPNVPPPDGAGRAGGTGQAGSAGGSSMAQGFLNAPVPPAPNEPSLAKGFLNPPAPAALNNSKGLGKGFLNAPVAASANKPSQEKGFANAPAPTASSKPSLAEGFLNAPAPAAPAPAASSKPSLLKGFLNTSVPASSNKPSLDKVLSNASVPAAPNKPSLDTVPSKAQVPAASNKPLSRGFLNTPATAAPLKTASKAAASQRYPVEYDEIPWDELEHNCSLPGFGTLYFSWVALCATSYLPKDLTKAQSAALLKQSSPGSRRFVLAGTEPDVLLLECVVKQGHLKVLQHIIEHQPEGLNLIKAWWDNTRTGLPPLVIALQENASLEMLTCLFSAASKQGAITKGEKNNHLSVALGKGRTDYIELVLKTMNLLGPAVKGGHGWPNMLHMIFQHKENVVTLMRLLESEVQQRIKSGRGLDGEKLKIKDSVSSMKASVNAPSCNQLALQLLTREQLNNTVDNVDSLKLTRERLNSNLDDVDNLNLTQERLNSTVDDVDNLNVLALAIKTGQESIATEMLKLKASPTALIPPPAPAKDGKDKDSDKDKDTDKEKPKAYSRSALSVALQGDSKASKELLQAIVKHWDAREDTPQALRKELSPSSLGKVSDWLLKNKTLLVLPVLSNNRVFYDACASCNLALLELVIESKDCSMHGVKLMQICQEYEKPSMKTLNAMIERGAKFEVYGENQKYLDMSSYQHVELLLAAPLEAGPSCEEFLIAQEAGPSCEEFLMAQGSKLSVAQMMGCTLDPPKVPLPLVLTLLKALIGKKLCDPNERHPRDSMNAVHL